MRPGVFDYLRPESVAEAVALLGEGDSETYVLAGGQALIRQMRQRELRPRRIIDISFIAELAYVLRDAAGLTVGALTPVAVLAEDPVVRESCRALSEAAARVGDVQVRTRATAGGNVCTGWASDIGTVLVASGGDVIVRNAAGDYGIPAADFMARGARPCPPAEFIVALRFGTAPGSAFEKLSRRAVDPALASAAAFIHPGVGDAAVRLALGAVHTHIIRAETVERIAADAGVAAPAVAGALRALAQSLQPPSNPHASAAYRRRILPVVARRALEAAARRAGEGRRA